MRSFCLYDPHHKKTCLRGLRPRKTQTGLLSYRDQQRCWSDCAEAHADLRFCSLHMAKAGFLMTWLILSKTSIWLRLRSVASNRADWCNWLHIGLLLWSLQRALRCVLEQYLSHDMTKPTNWVCTQRRIRSVWASAQSDQSSLCAQWIAKDPRFLHVDSKDSEQTWRMPRLIWVFAGSTLTLLVLSCCGSFYPQLSCSLYIIYTWYCGIFKPTLLTANVAEWLRPLIFSTQNRSSSHSCWVRG